MFRPRAVAKVKPSNYCNTVLIFGIGNGFLTSHIFTSLKSLAKHTVSSFFDVIKEGDVHSDAGGNCNTPSSQSLFNYFIVVSLCTLGTENDLSWYGLVPSFSSNEMASVFQSPSVPSKSSSYCLSNSSNLFRL